MVIVVMLRGGEHIVISRSEMGGHETLCLIKERGEFSLCIKVC